MIFFNIGRGSGNGVTTARDMDQVLRSHVVPFVDRHWNYTFQHDNARAHTARSTHRGYAMACSYPGTETD